MSRVRNVASSIGWPSASQEKDITKLAAGASFSFAGRIAGRILFVLSQVLLARLLGPRVFGLYAIGWTILLLAGVLAPLGLEKGVIRFGARYWQRDPSGLKGVLFKSLGFGILSGLLLGSALFLASTWLAEQVFEKPDLTSVLRWFALAFPLVVGLKVAAAATRLSQRTDFAVYAEDIGQPATYLVLLLFFLAAGLGLSGAIAAVVISFGLAFLLAFSFLRKLFPEAFAAKSVSGPSARELMIFSLPAAFAGVFGMFTLWADRLFVGYFLTASDVGIYQAVSQSALVALTILAAINTIFSPLIADLYHKKKMERLEELFRVSTKWGLYMSLPVFLVIFFAPREVMTVVFGRQYASGAPPLVILAVAQLINVGTGAVGYLLIMTGRQTRWLVASGLAFLMNVSLNWLLIPQLGLIGAALATSITIGGLFLIALLLVRRSLGLWPYDRRYRKGLLATLAAAAALYLVRPVAVDSPTLTLLITGIVSIGVFGGTLLLLGLDAEDREFIHLIKRRPELRKRTELNANSD